MGARYVVGFDISTKALGYAVLQDGLHLASGTFRPVEDALLKVIHPEAVDEAALEVNTADMKAYRRIVAIWKFCDVGLWSKVPKVQDKALSWDQVTCLGVEWPMGSHGSPRTDVLMGMAFCVGVLVAATHHVPLMAVHQSTVKGTGYSKDKLGAAAMLAGESGWGKRQGDRADAIGVAMAVDRVVRIESWIQSGRMTL